MNMKKYVILVKQEILNTCFYDFETNQETGVHVVNWVDCEDYGGNKKHIRDN